MSATRFNLIDLAGLEQWQRGQCDDNSQRLLRLRHNLSIAMAEELTPRQRQIMEMYYFDGRSVTDIAQELQVNKSTVSRSLRRAEHRLHHSLRYSL